MVLEKPKYGENTKIISENICKTFMAQKQQLNWNIIIGHTEKKLHGLPKSTTKT